MEKKQPLTPEIAAKLPKDVQAQIGTTKLAEYTYIIIGSQICVYRGTTRLGCYPA